MGKHRCEDFVAHSCPECLKEAEAERGHLKKSITISDRNFRTLEAERDQLLDQLRLADRLAEEVEHWDKLTKLDWDFPQMREALATYRASKGSE